MNTVVCIATGPSLSLDQVDAARRAGFRLFGCNRVYQEVPDLELLYGCNLTFWQYYWSRGLAEHAAEKWTTNEEAARTFHVEHIREAWGEGLCEEPGLIFHGHGSGYSLLGMAHKKGAERILLLGYDMRYPPGYDGYERIVGEGKRHYFGEYPSDMQHWPKRPWVDLIPLYAEIRRQGLVELVSCTPGSALNDVLPYAEIERLAA